MATIVFDEEIQTGAAESTYAGANTYHGVAVIRLRDDRIANWREHATLRPRPGRVHGPEPVLT